MILGVASLPCTGDYTGKTPTDLMVEALNIACDDAKISIHQLNGIYTNAAIAAPNGFQALHLAQYAGMVPTSDGRSVLCKTISSGGASGVQAIIDCNHAMSRGEVEVAAIVTADLTLSLEVTSFLELMNRMIADPREPNPHDAVIPKEYNRVAEWHMKHYGTTRDQLAMVSVAMARQAKYHPGAMAYGKNVTLEKVLQSPSVASVTSLYECSRRADGANAIIIATPKFVTSHLRKHPSLPTPPRVIGTGEASGFLRPPDPEDMREGLLPLKEAADRAYKTAKKTVKDIDFFGLYDCFPVTLLTAVEDVGLANTGKGGQFWEDVYNKNPGKENPLNINTHGGLMHFGAPGSATALFNVVEAVQQMRGKALGLQVKNVKTALCYGNGGILSHSSVVILEKKENHNNIQAKL